MGRLVLNKGVGDAMLIELLGRNKFIIDYKIGICELYSCNHRRKNCNGTFIMIEDDKHKVHWCRKAFIDIDE